ncbi:MULTISPECIES: ankyrin repeat domain-containing protein [Thauera]|uniref:Ankyrin n=1 Tax=Thauera aminoaromatica S2 TaxID=1234381 RepID=N6Z6P4_THASP|nr:MULTISPECIES: ankyrin repeat domain-containing protein [Thauera]ENO87839.1 ankyrin [Thauera aminoaromatica S2]MBP6132367.1 ankyrin repeat domain-containing protein [Thauera sp.]
MDILLLGFIGWTLLCCALIARKAGYSGWWSILMVIPIISLVLMWRFPFLKWPALRRQPQPESVRESSARMAKGASQHDGVTYVVPAIGVQFEAASQKNDEAVLDALLEVDLVPAEVSLDRIYEEVAEELERERVDKGLWTRLYAEFDGDERKVKVGYIKARAEKLLREKGEEIRIARLRHEEKLRAISQLKMKRDYIRENIDRASSDGRADAGLEGLSSTHTATLFLNSVRFSRIDEARSWLDENPALVDVKDSGGMTALHIAAREGYADMIKFLIQRGASLTARNLEGKVPLDLSAGFGAQWINEVLGSTQVRQKRDKENSENSSVRKGVDIALMNVRASRKLLTEDDMIRALREKGSSLAKNFWSDVKDGNHVFISRELDRNPWLAAVAFDYGETALHKAVGRKDLWLIEHLLIAGAMPDKAADYGKSALDLARASGGGDIVTLLECCSEFDAKS